MTVDSYLFGKKKKITHQGIAYYKNNLIDTWVNISSVALTYLFLKGSINTKYLFHNDWDSKPSSLEQHAKDEHDDTGKVYII